MQLAAVIVGLLGLAVAIPIGPCGTLPPHPNPAAASSSESRPDAECAHTMWFRDPFQPGPQPRQWLMARGYGLQQAAFAVLQASKPLSYSRGPPEA